MQNYSSKFFNCIISDYEIIMNKMNDIKKYLFIVVTSKNNKHVLVVTSAQKKELSQKAHNE